MIRFDLTKGDSYAMVLEKVHLSHLFVMTGWTGTLYGFLEQFHRSHALADQLKVPVAMGLTRAVRRAGTSKDISFSGGPGQ